jgi:hypothetical protein
MNVFLFKFIILLYLIFGKFHFLAQTSEIGYFLDIKELEAQKIEKVEISNRDFCLISFFENAVIITYFKSTVCDNKFSFLKQCPIKQEFFYKNLEKVVTTKNWENKIWDDDITGYAFYYDNLDLYIDGKKYNHIYVTINDSFEGDYEARYTISLIPENSQNFIF